MTFEKIGKDINYLKYETDEPKVSIHLTMNKKVMENLNKVIAVYKSYGYDATNRSELLSMIAFLFLINLEDNENSVFSLMKELKHYREVCL